MYLDSTRTQMKPEILDSRTRIKLPKGFLVR